MSPGLPAPLPDTGLTPSRGADGAAALALPTQSRGSPSQVRDELPADGILRLVCRSWLLWPGFKKMLGEKSNILSFASDFHILKEEIYQVYNDYWRVFGKDYTLPPDKLPRNNSLQRGMADVIVRGENIGWGYGLILFDGEKIVR